jgi:hypothetical protein
MLCRMGLALFLLFVLSITPIANATEAHEQTLFVTPGHVVFKDEDGKIEVR